MEKIIRIPAVTVFVKYEETEVFADCLEKVGVPTSKVYLSAELKDDRSFTYDEVRIETSVVICDSFETANLAETCKVNNARFYYLNLNKNVADNVVLLRDFYVIEVKDCEKKTRNDWEQAAVLFKNEELPKSSYCNTYC